MYIKFCTWIFLATLFVIFKTKDSPYILQWVNGYTNSDIAISQYHSIMKRNVAVINATTLMHIQRIMLNPKNQSQIVTCQIIPFLEHSWNLKKNSMKGYPGDILRVEEWGKGRKDGEKGQCEDPVVRKMFCILTESTSIPWLSYCTTILLLL